VQKPIGRFSSLDDASERAERGDSIGLALFTQSAPGIAAHMLLEKAEGTLRLATS
jgi:hypothetical protein